MNTMPPPAANDAAASLSASIEALGLPARQTAYLKGRWLDQLEWFEAKAGSNQRTHRRLRIAALVGGVVGVAVALEGFLRPGDRWLQYRQTAELLRTEW
ncbi:DUF4231 domain-containing protein [Ilumatobacter sp.]|uniref:DUF4231 domain-containing protein n=1 Tax=Ilumatobacter sp. TaxID=1967498 RepID=UPI003C3D92B3